MICDTECIKWQRECSYLCCCVFICVLLYVCVYYSTGSGHYTAYAIHEGEFIVFLFNVVFYILCKKVALEPFVVFEILTMLTLKYQKNINFF
jgi:hypothetical protein